MGLLDALQSDDGLLGLALLSAGAAKPVRTSLGEGLLGGMQLVQQSRNAREDRAQRMRMQQMQEQALLAQLDERKRAMTEAERQAAEWQRIQQVISGAFSPTQPIQANAASGIAGPRPEALGAVGQRRPVDFQQLVAQGVPPELAKNLAEAQNWGRPKVARTIEEMGPSGPTTVQFDDYGNRVGGGIAKPVQLQAQDLGGRVAQWNPFTGAMVGQGFQKSNSPDALLSAETARRGQNMADARAREKNTIDRDAVGKVEWKQDVNGAWVGLPKEVSGAGPVTPVTTATAGKREQQARNAIDIINEAEKLIDKGTGSYIGAGVDLVGKAFGGATPGAVAGGQLKALEGALMMAQPRMEGPQSNMDVQLYRQMAAQIGDPTVPPKIKKAALDTVKALHKKYAGEAAQSSATTAPAAKPSLDDLMKKYGD